MLVGLNLAGGNTFYTSTFNLSYLTHYLSIWIFLWQINMCFLFQHVEGTGIEEDSLKSLVTFLSKPQTQQLWVRASLDLKPGFNPYLDYIIYYIFSVLLCILYIHLT